MRQRLNLSLSRSLGWMLLALALPACRSTSKSFEFLPSPAEILVQAEGDASAVARVLVAVPGALRERSAPDGLARMLVRLRVENRGVTALKLELESCKLVDSNLVAFGPAELRSGPEAIEPGDEAIYNLGFPYPEGLRLSAPNVAGVNLQWVLSDGELAWESSVTLERSRQQSAADYAWDARRYDFWGPRFFFTRRYGC